MQKIKEIIINFWEKDIDKYFSRDISIPDFNEKIKKAIILVGPRRSGKTSICFNKINNLLADGLDKKNILYVNFEDENLIDFKLEDFDVLLKSYFELSKKNINDKDIYFFFDEIQNIKFWEKFIVRILNNFNIKIYITGSSAKMLSSEINTALRGKSISIEVLGLNFREFLKFKNFKLEENFYYSINQLNNYKNFLKDFVIYGAFPEVVLENDINNKNYILKNYYDLIFYRDIVDRYSIRDIGNIKKFRKILTYNFTQKISLKKISDEIGVGYSTITNWYEYFLDSFYGFSLKKFDFSILDVEKSFSKFYLSDNGFFSTNFYELNKYNFSTLFENTVFLEFRKAGYKENENIFYFSDRKIGEIDFVTFKEGKIACYQVAWNIDDEKTLKRELKSLKKLKEIYKIENLNLIVGENVEKTYTIDGIKIIPFFDFKIL